MKTKNAQVQQFGLILLMCTILGIQELKSQIPALGTGESDSIKLSGSYLRTEDIVSKSDVVFVGEITGLGIKADFAPGAPEAGPVFNGVAVKVLQVLRGSVGAHTSVTLFINFLQHERKNGTGKIKEKCDGHGRHF